MIVQSARELEARFDELGPEDLVLGPMAAKFVCGPLAADLLERGVRFVPSVLCQWLSRSKCAQAVVLQRWMAPHTLVVSRRAELMEAVSYYARHGIDRVVSKQEKMHCGFGIRRWENAEVLYNAVAFADQAFPFVVQPFMADLSDVRVIIVGDYVEAYFRENLYNFRANLAVGGGSRALSMDAGVEAFCRAAMERGRFPYAHIDLQLTERSGCYLAEITLDGGISAARISRQELNRKKRETLEKEAEKVPKVDVR
jgi:ribosomal protein S6--L-glutamate ligase